MVAEIASVLASHNMEANEAVATLYRDVTAEAVYLHRKQGEESATRYLHKQVDQGYDRKALKDCLDVYYGDLIF